MMTGMATSILTVIRDQYPNIPCWRVVVGIVIFGLSVSSLYTTPIGQYLINFLDFYGASFVALSLAIFELLTVSWIYGVDRFCDDIEFMLKRKTGLYWRLCWKIFTPFIMISIMIYFVVTWKAINFEGHEYPPLMHSTFLFLLNHK
jgi:solute carrier family 6 (neurotransmitter transporter, glycine) member 5/9